MTGASLPVQNRQHAVQVVRAAAILAVTELEWRGLGAREQQERLEEPLASDRRKGFDFAHAPILRLALLRMAVESWVCVWTYHHVLMDGWSMPSGISGVLQNNRALSQGGPLRLKPAPHDHRFNVWLRRP